MLFPLFNPKVHILCQKSNVAKDVNYDAAYAVYQTVNYAVVPVVGLAVAPGVPPLQCCYRFACPL